MWRRAMLLPPMLLLASALGACGGSRAPVTVAAVGLWTGPEEQALQHGIELAVAAVNRDGGIDGHPLQVVFKDDRNDNVAAAQVARELVQDPNVVAVIGHTRSDPTLVAMRVYDGKMPVVSARLTSLDIAGLSQWVFQLLPADSAYASALVRFAAARNVRRAAVIFNNTARGRNTAEQFRKQFSGEIVGIDPVVFPAPLPGDVEIFAQYHLQQTPDMVFAAIGAERAQDYVRAAQQEGLRAAVVGWDVWENIKHDPALPGAYFYVLPFDLAAGRPETQRFVADYTQKHGAAPSSFAALGYDAVKIIAAAGKSGATRAGIRDGLAAFSGQNPFVGAIGPVYFTPDGVAAGPQPVVVPLHSASREVKGS